MRHARRRSGARHERSIPRSPALASTPRRPADRASTYPHSFEESPKPPEELKSSRAARASWEAAINSGISAANAAEEAATAHYEVVVERKPGTDDERWKRFVEVLARQAAEPLLPAAIKVATEIRCTGRIEGVSHQLAAHPLAEVRTTAAGLRRKAEKTRPDDKRFEFPSDFDEETAVHNRHAPPRQTALELKYGQPPPRLSIPTVDLIWVDSEPDIHVAAGAAYEASDRPYGAIVKALQTQSLPTSVRKTVEAVTRTRLSPAQPPDPVLGLARMKVEATATMLAWRPLAAMAAKAGAVVVLQPANPGCGTPEPPDAVKGSAAEGEWRRRLLAHETLWSRLRDEGISPNALQYALTGAHMARGTIECGADRAVRIIDWLMTQRGRGPLAHELRLIGGQMYRHLATSAAPMAADAVFRTGRNIQRSRKPGQQS